MKVKKNLSVILLLKVRLFNYVQHFKISHLINSLQKIYPLTLLFFYIKSILTHKTIKNGKKIIYD